jgi:hypothetical protein
MNKLLFKTTMTIAAALLFFCAIIIGCTTSVPNPYAGLPNQPPTIQVADTNKINAGSAAASTVAGVASSLYPPAALVNPLIPIGTSIALAISTALAAWKNQKNKNILAAVVKGVESAAPFGGTDLTPISLAVVKSSIKSSATAAGVQPALHEVVQANT